MWIIKYKKKKLRRIVWNVKEVYEAKFISDPIRKIIKENKLKKIINYWVCEPKNSKKKFLQFVFVCKKIII